MLRTKVTSHRSTALRLAPHKDHISRRSLRSWADRQKGNGRPLAIDLFSGAGGLSLGLEDAGWAVAAAVDIYPRALETHRHNFPGLALNLDLSTPGIRDGFVAMWDGISIDLVAGGPPCQPFSRAGRSKIRSLVDAGTRNPHDERKELWQAFLDVALRLKPRAILMENVPDMGLGDDFFVIRQMVEELEHAGYATEVRLIDAWRFGVPQHRQRLLLLARNDDCSFDWPEPVTTFTDLASSIGDLPPLKASQGHRTMPYDEPEPTNWFLAQMRQGAETGVVHDHMTRAVRPDDLEIFKLMDSKTLYSDLPEHLRRYRADSFNDKYKRLDWQGLSRSITAHIAKDGYWYIHPGEHRTLTVREAARIQSFPDRFRFAGTRSDAFKQIGNAVPPLLGAAAATALRQDTLVVDDRTRWVDVRGRIIEWGNGIRPTCWFAFPGSDMTPPGALVGALATRLNPVDPDVQAALSYFRGRAGIDKTALDEAAEHLPTAHRLWDRLRPFTDMIITWDTISELAISSLLSPGERRLLRLYSGDDVLLCSAGPLRVAASVAGTQSHKLNRLTEGRLDLGRLVGGGDDAPHRMATVRLISQVLCHPQNPDCGTCPLSPVCHRARTIIQESSQSTSLISR